MTDWNEVRQSLRDNLLESFSDEYSNASETWKALEAKAQSTVTIGGIFLAAAFAYSRELTAITCCGRVLLIMAIVLLLGSVAFCVAALRIQKIVDPPQGTFAAGAVLQLTDPSKHLDEETLQNFTRDRVTRWKESLESLIARNDEKASLIWTGQIFLGSALLPIGVFTVMRLLS